MFLDTNTGTGEYRDTKKFLSDTKFYESYARFDDEKGRYETWSEAVDRVMNMHRQFYKEKGKLTPKLEEYILEAQTAYENRMVLGAQRALQFGGDQLLKHHMKMYNCFDQHTTFVTSEGMKSFFDFNDGDEVTVLTHTGAWKKAIVKSYGEQPLYQYTFRKNTSTKTINATKNHRWLLHDGSQTTNIVVGDRLLKSPETFAEFDWDTANPVEQLYWAYGYVYGDGTVNGNYSMVRLCKHDVGLEERFLKLGFKSSTSASLEGDVMIYTGTYKKTLPDLTKDSPELIRAFVAGYLLADGERNYNPNGQQYNGIQSSNPEAIDFIRNAFPIAGVHIISEKNYTGQETNFGTRPYTIRFHTNDSSGSKHNSGWKLDQIEDIGLTQTVWCLEVEEDHSFILSGGIVTGNCTSSYADRPEFFGEIFYILLCGAGAGFSVQKHHVAKLPRILPRKKNPKTHIIEDSIEGWATALDVLISSYLEGGGKHPEFEGRKVYFDTSLIRPKNAMISGGFKAPGPEPLRIALDRIEHILQGLVIKGIDRLRPIHVYDIVMHAADSVISGGVRRSATICLFSPDDEEMAKAKTGNWFFENPQRGRSNNSAVIVRKEAKREQFAQLMESIKQFGEPGFVFVESTEHTTNPCVEIGMFPQLNGKSGFQGCNLTEINGGACTTEELFYAACRSGAILGTLQAGYTDFKFVTDITKQIFDREALLGVSITGWMANPKILFDEAILTKGAEIVKQVNKEVAELLGINAAARTTCVKPSGNASVLLMTPSGIHGDHAPMYLRHVQLNKDTEVAQLIKATNPYMVEESVWSANKTDFAVAFPVIAQPGSLFKDDLYGVKHLELIKKAQKYWVDAGTNEELCADPGIRHNVSNTVMVDNWDEVEEYVFNNRDYFAGISFISGSGDKDYAQAPNTKVSTADEILKEYGTGSIFASGLVVEGLKAFGDLWVACSQAHGFGEDLSSDDANNLLKKDWVRRFDKFALNYFAGDKKKAEYCLKDVYNLHKFIKIQQNLLDINYTQRLLQKKFIDVDTLAAAACVGVNTEGCVV